MTAREVAEMLAVSVKTVFRYGQFGILRRVKFQSNVRFREPDVLDYIEKHTERPRPLNGNGAKRRSIN